MKYKKHEYDNYTVHLFNTDEFKSIMVSTILTSEFTKESLTKSELLRGLLTRSTLTCKNETELVRRIYDIYGAGMIIEKSIHNNVLSIDFFIEFLEEKYTEEGMVGKTLDHYFDIIFNPNVEDGKFETTNFKIAKETISNIYDREKENKVFYAIKRAAEMLDEEYLGYTKHGYKEFLDDLNEENMYEYYKELFKKSNANIFIIGNFDNEKMLNIINDKVKGKFYKNDNKYRNNNFLSKGDIKEKVEKENNNQSELVMLYKIINMTERERNVILPIFNRIFGVDSNSKLFKNIREEKSLVYDIRSNADREENIISVIAGIDASSKDLTIKSIKEELNNMKNGNITDDEIIDAKKSRKRILEGLLDDQEHILYSKISSILFKNDDLYERLEALKTVTKEEVIELSKKLELDVIYMLEGTCDEED